MRFYRFHWTDCPEFSADNAWSALWGRERNETGDAVVCLRCDGTGEDLLEAGAECPECDGTGWEDCLPGYSCYLYPEDLIGYFRDPARGEPADDAGRVVVFEGRRVGTGFDGEDRAIPDRVVEEMTWSEFVKRFG